MKMPGILLLWLISVKNNVTTLKNQIFLDLCKIKLIVFWGGLIDVHLELIFL